MHDTIFRYLDRVLAGLNGREFPYSYNIDSSAGDYIDVKVNPANTTQCGYFVWKEMSIRVTTDPTVAKGEIHIYYELEEQVTPRFRKVKQYHDVLFSGDTSDNFDRSVSMIVDRTEREDNLPDTIALDKFALVSLNINLTPHQLAKLQEAVRSGPPNGPQTPQDVIRKFIDYLP